MKINLLIFISIFLLLLTGCTGKKTVVAVWETGSLNMKELKTLLKEAGMRPKEWTYENQCSFISNEIQNRIFLEEARKKGFYDKRETQESLEKRKKEIIRKYTEDRVMAKGRGKYRSSDLKKFLTLIQLKLIWLNTPNTLDSDYRSEKKRSADEAYKRLKKGEDFQKIANIYSEDPRNFNGGLLGKLKFDELDKEFQTIVPKMSPGDMKWPVKTEKGIYILYLENQTKENRNGIEAPVYWVRGILLIPEAENPDAIKDLMEKGKKIFSIVKKDPEQFAIMANRFSEDDRNKKGGAFKQIKLEELTFSLAEPLYKIKEKKYSSVLENQFGFFIFFVDSITQPDNKKILEIKKNKKRFEAYKKQITDARIWYNRDTLMEDYKIRLLKKADVVKDYSVFTNSAFSNTSWPILKIKENNQVFIYQNYLDLFKHLPSESMKRYATYIDRVGHFEKNLVIPEIIYLDGIRQGFLQKKEVQKQIDNFLSQYLITQYTDYLITSQSVNEGILLEYYTDNQEKYGQKSFSEAREFVLRDYHQGNRRLFLEAYKNRLLKDNNFRIVSSRLLSGADRKIYRMLEKAEYYATRKEFNKGLALYQKIIKQRPSEPLYYLKAYSFSRDLSDLNKANDFLNQMKTESKLNRKRLVAFLDDPVYQYPIVSILGDLQERTSILPLMDRINTTNRTFQAEIIKALGKLRAMHASDVILDIVRAERSRNLSITNNLVLWFGIECLGQIGDTKVSSYFRKWLVQTKDSNIKMFLIPALGDLKDKSAIPILEEHYLNKNMDWGVQVQASITLTELTGKEYTAPDPPPQPKSTIPGK